MNLPKKVTCDGQSIAISYDKKLARMPGGYLQSGEYQANRIRISPHLTKRSEQATVLHELLHHCWERAGLGRYLSRSTEELVLSGLDLFFTPMFQENPDLVEYLSEPHS